MARERVAGAARILEEFADRFSSDPFKLAVHPALTSVHRFVDSAAPSQFPDRVAVADRNLADFPDRFSSQQ
jgi:hypothetical protein